MVTAGGVQREGLRAQRGRISGTSGERRLSRYWPYAAASGAPELTRAAVSPYTALMAASQPMVAEMVLGAYSFGRDVVLEKATIEDMCGPQVKTKPSLEVIYDNV